MGSWIFFWFLTIMFLLGINLEKFVPSKTEYEERFSNTMKPVLFVLYVFASVIVFYNNELADKFVVEIINFFG
ncbi:hypothetical protein Q9G24_001780 [Campylobacter coli]|uniref:hypothetical protein n=1 Tax=Campylobacter coli TaxID=195 RepID=UPI0018112CCC|nr:hypothetical protein [Campylobacter coli]HEE9014253.1 hypothetical protein [Campylobacter jejuni]EAH9863609.1 hypothetical protein [Campylobacter coli]EAI3529513.1 hypothetical protein [Campylobacter coli]EAI6558522.1 hypothetical protein [Campylobacter coli]ELH7408957.1 hypothetical protein [Campylobacter coli]